MNLINPELSFIKYRKKKILIKYQSLVDYYGLYDPNEQILLLDQNIKGERLFNTLIHG
jgi:hypothetical protein